MKDEQEGDKVQPTRARATLRSASSPSEFAFINRLRQRTPHQPAATAVSKSSLLLESSSYASAIGDDAAVLHQQAGRETLITTDLLIEDIDFRRRTTRPEFLGHKALAVSLSDIAAMGARPRFCLISVGVPRAVWRTSWLDKFYAGLLALADAHGVALVGGDTSRTPELIVIDSIVLGETESGRAVLRSGARPGDAIFVTGALGGAAAGLRMLEQGASFPAKPMPRLRSHTRDELILRQLCPTPRVTWGAWLGAQRLATAMIDLSDGLSSDLTHLCRESNTGALIEASSIPLDPSIAQSIVADTDALALHGGEDFELLFTVRAHHAKGIPKELDGVHATRIGTITARGAGIKLHANGRLRALKSAGFDHFGNQRG